jgi:O-antigen/teichoic acid export membrane protein
MSDGPLQPSIVPSDESARPFWLRRHWWASTGQATLGLVVATGLSFVATLFAARGLGPRSYGAVVLAVSVAGSAAALLDVSLEEAIVHFGARVEREGDRGGLAALLRLSLAVDVGVGLVVFLAILGAAGPLATLASNGRLNPTLVRLAALELLAITANGSSGAALLLSGKPELRAWAMGWTSLLRLVAVLVVMSAWGTGYSVLWAYVCGSAMGAVSQAGLALRSFHRRFGRGERGRVPVGLRRLAAFGIQSSMVTTVQAMRAAVIAVILGRTVGSVEVGLFNVAMFPMTLVAVASAPLRITTFPEQARLAAEGRGDVLWQGIKAYSKLSLWVGLAGAAVGYALLGWLLPLLYSSKYAGAVLPARILLIGALAFLVVAWAKALPAAIGRPHVRTLVSLLELAVTAALVVVLANHGAVGAAVAVSAASAALALVWIIVARRMLAGMRPEAGGVASLDG